MPPPEATNSLDSRRQGSSSRNFPCTTSAAPTNVPALSPDEGSRRAEAGLRNTAPRRRAPPSASASGTDSRPGEACPPPPHPTPPPHLPAVTQSCSYYGSRCRPSHSRGGFAPGGLRGEAVVAAAAAAAAASPGLTVAGRRPGTQRNPRPTRAAPATGLLTRPAAASVTPGRRGPAVCSGAGRRGLLGRAPGGGAGGEFAAPRLLLPARALPGSPEGRCLGAHARLRTLWLLPSQLPIPGRLLDQVPLAARRASRAQRRQIPGASLQTPRLRTLKGSQSDSRGGTLIYVYQIYIHTYINILQAKLKGFFPTSQLKGPVPPRKTKGLPPLPFSACLDGIWCSNKPRVPVWGAILCFKHKVGNPALDYISACRSPHPSNAPHRSPETANSSPRGRPIAAFPWPAPTPSSIAFPRKNLCQSSDPDPRLGVKTDPKPRGGSTFLHLLIRLITRAPVILGLFCVFVFFQCKGFRFNPSP